MKPPKPQDKTCQDGELQSDESRFTRGFAQNPQKQPSAAAALAPSTDHDLARVVDAWPRLPVAVRQAVLKLIRWSAVASSTQLASLDLLFVAS
jgi:hypothetical protein